MKVPFLDLQAQYTSLKAEIDPAIQRVVDSCAFAGGPEVAAFEDAFAAYCEAKHCVAVRDGTAALELILRARGIGPGDEVIVPANTFFATAEAVSLAGAVPVFTDVLESTANIDPSSIEHRITDRTKAVIPVHLYGQPADMDAVSSVATAHDLLVVEDACQAHGARYNGRRTGGIAAAAAFSFYPGKNLGAYGEAGAITTSDPDLAARMRMLRDHGQSSRYHHALVGTNARMDGIQGAVLAAKLPHLDSWNERRRSHAGTYRSLLGGCEGIRFFDEAAGCLSSHHLFVVRVAERDRVQQDLKQAGIDTGIHYPVPIHLQPAYASLGYGPGDCPVAELLSREILSLPMFAELTNEQIAYVADALKSAVRG